MLNLHDILETITMIQDENLDIYHYHGHILTRLH